MQAYAVSAVFVRSLGDFFLNYLVYLFSFQLVSRSVPCQMNEDTLAKVFGPIIVGYSCPEPQLMQTVNETLTQKAVSRRFRFFSACVQLLLN